MAFDNPTNHGRAEKIAEIVSHVKKSAESNRAEAEEIARIMEPAVEALREIGAIAVQPIVVHNVSQEAAPVAHHIRNAALRAGERAALHLADGASLKQLVAALLGRLEEFEGKLEGDDHAQDADQGNHEAGPINAPQWSAAGMAQASQ